MQHTQAPQPVIYEQVYYVDSAQTSRPLNPIAIKPSIFGNKIKWNDTGRGQFIEASEIKCESPKKIDATHPPEEIIIVTHTGDKIILKVLDLKTYNSKLRAHVEGHPNFDSDKELQDYYLHKNFQAY